MNIKNRILTILVTLSLIVSVWMVPSAAAVSFTDVKPTDASYTAVMWAVESGITNGVSEGVFAPNNTCNVGQVITYLWRAFGEPVPTIKNPFSDVSESNYYFRAALWAYEKGIVNGATFGAGADCTRLATVTYLWRAAGSPEPVSQASFSDIAGNNKAVSWAVEQGITNGFSNGDFRPTSTCTRSQIIIFLHRDIVIAGNTPEKPQSQPLPNLPENGKYQVTTPEGVYEYEVKDWKISTDSWVKYYANDGTTYYGPMVGNKFTGQCIINYKDGDNYVGAVAQNLKSGTGQYAWANGDIYSGQWANDKMNGYGTYSFAVGGSIRGNFVNDVPNGACVYTDSSGVAYDATWTNGTCVSMTKR